MSSENSTNFNALNIQGLINPDIVTFFLTLNITICANVIGLLGILGNIVSLINFTKYGMQDSVSVTLSALVISDSGALFAQLFINVLISPFWKSVDHPFFSLSILSSTLFYPREYFIRVSGTITVFASLERCLCVIIPMRVKRIITRNVAIVVNVCIFIAILSYLLPPLAVTYYEWRVDPRKNRSLIFLVYRDNAESVFKVSYMVLDLFLPYCTFFVLIVCNTVIVLTLKSKSKWRQSTTGHGVNQLSGKPEISTKEKKLVIMLVTVSTIFIGCLSPQSAMLTALGIVRELKINGPYFDLSLLVYSFTFLLETINCSVSVLVYYNMSSKFRDRIHSWLPCCKFKT
ncbi:FMRFamide receptor [Biomphalaria glabrata]|nr:FMRFamide receptor-like [Biomphalaria glabrata]